jgi:L-threonylcarbamoyladenylate synthase
MIAEAVHFLLSGGTIIYPTETVYGIGASAFHRAAIQKVFDIKRRPASMPLSVAISSFEMLDKVAEIEEGELAILEALLPGPVTVLLKAKESLPELLTAGSSLVGIRYPEHELALKLIDGAGPITSTSANLTGSPSPAAVDEIDIEISQSVDMVIDGGRCRFSEPSTVLDLGARKIIRPGAGMDKVLEVIG